MSQVPTQIFRPGLRLAAALLALSSLFTACQAQQLPSQMLAAARSGPAAGIPVAVQRNNAGLRFPNDWQGVWQGSCKNTGPGGVQTYAPVEMRLTIQPKTGAAAGSWQWQIEYIGGDSPDAHQTRAYTLKPVDAAKGQWVIDEHNGILLDNFTVSGQLLLEQFSVGQTLLYGRHELVDARHLSVELTSFSLQAPRASGAEPYPVKSFRLLSLQDCPLTRS